MKTTNKPAILFWVIAVLALVWNLLGVMAYLGQQLMSPENLALLSEAEQEAIVNRPAWATSAFAIAVWGGLLAAMFLLIKKRWAQTVFIISFLGVLVQMYFNFFVIDSLAIYGPGGLFMPVLIVLFGIFLIWWSDHSIKKGWLK